MSPLNSPYDVPENQRRVDMTEDEISLATAWSDFRKEYGVSADDRTRAAEYRSFAAGWAAAKGTLDVGGVQR